MYNKEITKLIEKIDSIKGKQSSGLPENVYFLDEQTILCGERTTGDSRYPYAHDGFTLWAYSSGYITIGESTFYVIPPSDEGKEPFLSFFGGLDNGKDFDPISIMGVARQPKENVTRYTVYTPKVFYYIAQTNKIDFVLRGYVDENKKVYFSQYAINKSDKKVKTYLASYFNCLLKYTPNEDFETKWFKACKQKSNGFEFYSVVDLDRQTHLDHYGVIRRNTDIKNIKNISSTTSRNDYTGGKSTSLNCSKALFDGKFEKEKKACKFTETAVCGDIIQMELDSKEIARVDYTLDVTLNKEIAEKYNSELIPTCDQIDTIIASAVEKNDKKFAVKDMLKMTFSDSDDDKLDAKDFTYFVSNVIRQVEYCALAKNSGVSLLGIRDVLQQLEASLIWNPKDSRAKIIEVLNFMDTNGRLARQYSIPATKNAIPQMDLRPFIDQGVWAINAIYQYLSYTNDYSILEEECGYYNFLSGNQVSLCDKKSSVLTHFLDIMNFLKNHLDEKTQCLRAMYGDWNDALDGLGVTTDKDKEYGSGVSVMATLQYYANLNEMIEILQKIGGHSDTISEYEKLKVSIRNGLEKYAIVEKDGQRKILHGWGDKMSYQVCGFNDVDGISRDGLVVNAYWVISKAIDWDESLKQDIMRSYKNLESKYGLKTFNPHFEVGVKGVGRIVNLPKGTAENGAVYIHATLFGIWSLFMLNESEFAINELKKIIPLTHKNISTTPFIMSNSYVLNEEFEMDGESMSDWYTGSANVLLKTLVRFVFGIQPSLDKLVVQPSSYVPFKNCNINVVVRGTQIALSYKNSGAGQRKFIVNGKEYASTDDTEYGLKKIVLDKELNDNKVISIEIID